jgi:hypothetical protein
MPLTAYLAAAQKAKCVVCSSIVMPLFPTSSKSYAKEDVIQGSDDQKKTNQVIPPSGTSKSSDWDDFIDNTDNTGP